MSKKIVSDLKVNGKKVLIRVDFNVPMKDGVITDDTRVKAALPTIKYVIDNGGKLIIMSHLGRPKGEVVAKYSLKSVVAHLSELLGKPVAFANDCIGEEAEKVVNNLKNGEVALLENLRFHKEEEKNNPDFAKALASLGDIFL